MEEPHEESKDGPSFFEKVKCTIARFCDRIKLLLEKKEKFMDFIRDEVHRSAFSKARSEGFKLLRRLKPKKLQADIRFGFADPYRTGQVLAVLGVLYPWMGEYTRIEPDFENQVLEGTLSVKGKIRVIHFVILAWNLVWCKAVRTTYRHFKNFEW